jgi:DNA-binding SARP family transcriptional activator
LQRLVPPRIYLTGRLAVEHDGQVVLDEAELPARHGRLAFAYLATRWQCPASRADVIDALWSGDPPVEVDVTLSGVLSRLRALLRNAMPDAGVDVKRGQIGLRLPGGTWIDVEAMGNALDEAEGACRRGDHAQGWGPANVAIAIARRPFLPNEVAPWVETWRRKLLGSLARGLHCLSAISAANGEPAVAVQHAAEVLDLEPYRETAYQHLMRLHAGMGNAAEALRVFGRCREYLREELGASPSPETERLYLAVLRGEPGALR